MEIASSLSLLAMTGSSRRRLPRVTPALRAGIRLHPRPAARARLPAPADRREAGARRGDRWTEAGDTGRLQRPLFASLRGHRADPGHAMRQWRRRGRHRPRLPVRAMAARASPRRYRVSADGGSAVRPHARRNRTGPGRRHHVPPRLADARLAWRRALARRAVLVRSARRADGTDRGRTAARTLP